MTLDEDILGHGVYTPREVARLVGARSQQVLRWTRGDQQHAPIWRGHYQFLDDDTTELSFTDLVELRVVNAMRKAGISLHAIRFAIGYARDQLQIKRPLASQSFKTDGKELLITVLERDDQYVSLSPKRPGQKVFKDIVAQSLSDLEYDTNKAVRWRPRNHSAVVIDPTRNFGDPSLDSHGISTRTLAKEFEVFRNEKYLSKIYEIPMASVRAALKFEHMLDAQYGQCAA